MKYIFFILFFIIFISKYKHIFSHNLRNGYFKSKSIKFKLNLCKPMKSGSPFGPSLCPEECRHYYNGNSYFCKCENK